MEKITVNKAKKAEERREPILIHSSPIKRLKKADNGKIVYYIFFPFFVAVFLLALYGDWEYDEAWTYLSIVNNRIVDLITYSKFKYANNHLINSLYFKLLQNYEISHVFFYRIPSILGFIIFYLAAIRTLNFLKIKPGYVIVLMLAPYLFYFSLGRGYGLAVGCFATSLYYLLRFIGTPKIKYAYYFILSGAISSLSIFSFIFPFVSMVILLAYYGRNSFKKRDALFVIVVVGLLVLYIHRVGKIVNDFDPNIIGSSSLLKNGTISSIFSDFSYFQQFWDAPYFIYLKYAVITCLVIPFFYRSRKNLSRSSPIMLKPILLLLILICFLLLVSAHVFLNAKYPQTRAVYFMEYIILLFILSSTVFYTRRFFFYLPIFIIGTLSLFQIAQAILNLRKPSTKEIILKTENHPLYAISDDPSIKLTNEVGGINKKNIITSSQLNNIVPLIQQDTDKLVFLFCPKEYLDSLNFSIIKVYDSRGGLCLYQIEKK